MSRRRLAPSLMVLACLVSVSDLQALANRVFVSARSGNNANACDNIATPCQTLQGAVSQLNPNGEAIVLDTGGYGPVNITQGVTIEAAPGVTAFIHPPSGVAVTINAPAAKVILRGLTIVGASGNGISATAIDILHVENCVIDGSGGNGIALTVPASGVGNLIATDSVFRNNAGTGVVVNAFALGASATATVDHCRFEGNGEGLRAEDNSKVWVRDSVASRTVNGFEAKTTEGGGLTVLTIENCLVTGNLRGIYLSQNLGSTTIRVSGSTVVDNAIGIDDSGGGNFLSFGNNRIAGNVSDSPFTATIPLK